MTRIIRTSTGEVLADLGNAWSPRPLPPITPYREAFYVMRNLPRTVRSVETVTRPTFWQRVSAWLNTEVF
jgi:hypothetical protein